MRIAALALCVLASAPAASAQEDRPGTTTGAASMGQLIAQGFEIKAAVPNGKRFTVFLQKDATGYVCEITNVSRSVCGRIN